MSESPKLQFQTEARSNTLQLAVSVFGTIATIEVVVTQEKLESRIPEPLGSGGVEMDCHAVADCLGASSNRDTSPRDLHKTETT